MVRALRRVVEREVLLDHARAEHVGHESHGDAVLVIGQPDHEAWEPLAQRGDDVQVQVVRVGGVGGRALQDAELVVDRQDHFDRALDVRHLRTSGGKNQRLSEGGDMTQ